MPRKNPFVKAVSTPQQSDDVSDCSDVPEVDEAMESTPLEEKSSVDARLNRPNEDGVGSNLASDAVEEDDSRPLKKRRCAEPLDFDSEVSANITPSLERKVSTPRREFDTIDLCDDDDDDEGGVPSDAKENSRLTPLAPHRLQTATKNGAARKAFGSQKKKAKFSDNSKRRRSTEKSTGGKKRKRSGGQTLFSMGFVSK